MKIQKGIRWTGLLLSAFFLFYSSEAFALTTLGQGAGIQPGGVPAPQTGYMKRFEVFKDISGGVLYTEQNTYDLTNVKVTYSKTNAQDRPTGLAVSNKVVGLIFFSNILKEVVIYP